MTLPAEYFARRAGGVTIQFVEHATSGMPLRHTVEPGSHVTLRHDEVEIAAVVVSCLGDGRLKIAIESIDSPSADLAIRVGESLIVDEANVLACALP
jgi:hypothetical protein